MRLARESSVKSQKTFATARKNTARISIDFDAIETNPFKPETGPIASKLSLRVSATNTHVLVVACKQTFKTSVRFGVGPK